MAPGGFQRRAAVITVETIASKSAVFIIAFFPVLWIYLSYREGLMGAKLQNSTFTLRLIPATVADPFMVRKRSTGD